jgi:RNA polymerase sigma-70 factor (TIGR02960 family)
VAERRCSQCGRPLPEQDRRRGRATAYCSAACRQKAYRDRKSPSESVTELVAAIRRQAGELDPQHPPTLEVGARTLAGSVRRLSALARDATRTVTSEPVMSEDAALVAAAQAGDESAFGALVERYRRELQVHCYRMLGSYDESEDLVQETFLRAWRRRETYQGRASFRAWLYRIATNACLDQLKRHPRAPGRYSPREGTDPESTPARLAWLQPYPDRLLEPAAPADTEPDTAVVDKETIELVYLTAIQHLAPRQRAVLILRDALGWTAQETADLLETSVASVNSALQRARLVMREHLPERRSEWSTADPTQEQRALLERYMRASAELDVREMAELMAELMAEDVRVTMPPNDLWFGGRDEFIAGVVQAFTPGSPIYIGEWRSVLTWANRQPAVAHYVRRPGTAIYRPQVLDVIRFVDGKVAEITAFEPHLFAAFDLPATLSDPISDR